MTFEELAERVRLLDDRAVDPVEEGADVPRRATALTSLVISALTWT
jgi:hypothetical protein